MIYPNIVLKIWTTALLFLWANRKQLAQFTLLPVTILAILGAIINSINTQNHNSIFLFYLILNIALYVMFAAAWHRFFLAPDNKKTIWQYMAWGGDKWKYLATLMTLSTIFMLFLQFTLMRPILWLLYSMQKITSLITNNETSQTEQIIANFQWQTNDIFILIALLLFAIPYSRLTMLLPAAASEKQLKIKATWKLSKGQNTLCFSIFISILAMQVIFAFIGVIFKIALGGNPEIQSEIQNNSQSWLSLQLLSEFIWQVFNYLTIAATITPLSITYQILKQNQRNI